MSVIEQQQQIPTGTWNVDRLHSSVDFAVKHMVVATFRGGFTDYDVTLSDGRIEGAVRVASIDIDDENLKGHLLTPDFFDAERHPQITFASTDVRVGEGGQLVVDGKLTINGITKAVEGRGTIAGPVVGLGEVERVGIELETVVDRTQFGLDWNAPLPKGGFALANDVKLHVAVELAKEA